MSKNRGLADTERFIGPLVEQIEEKLKSKTPITILEAGCGHGVALMELAAKFDKSLRLVGFNYSERDGNYDIMSRIARTESGVNGPADQVSDMPLILYLDASMPLPFADNSFDMIYSIASMYLYDDKARFLEECNRILTTDGLAMIDLSVNITNTDIAPHYHDYWEIWHEGKLVDARSYLKSFDGISIHESGKHDGPTNLYLELRRQTELDLGLNLVASVDLNFIWQPWGGIKSIYTTQRDFVPRYKSLGICRPKHYERR